MSKNRNKFGYKVPLKEISLHHEQSDDAYGDWSASSTWKDPKFIEKYNTYPDVTSDYDFEEGTTAFLVWSIWTTGDSLASMWAEVQKLSGCSRLLMQQENQRTS